MLGLEVRGTTLGAHLLAPLLRDGAPPLLVDRGWVPLERAQAVARPEGVVAVTGYVRPGETAAASPPGRPGGPALLHLRSRGDRPRAGPARGRALRPGGAGGARRAPNALPAAARSIPRPTNSHLGYAITWYGLAAALVGVFVVFAHRRLKEVPSP